MNEPIRVLLVDDEESFRKPMMERLIERGFQVEEAVGGPEALAKARDCGGNYHVAVIDQVMGPPNGIETMRQLHQLYPAIEVIVLTGWGDMEPGEKAMEMGAYRYMSKPVSNVDELVLNIRTAARFGGERQRGRALQQQQEQLNRRLRAVVDIFQAFRELRDGHLILERIAEAAKEALGVDVCTLLEYDPEKGAFSKRGAAGLQRPDAHYTSPDEFKPRFLVKPGPSLIPDVQQDEKMRDSDFVRREGIQSTVVCPLHVEGESLGLLFASYRYHKEPTPDEEKAIGLFADLAALVLCETRLREELSQTQKRLERRLFLDWMSMIETTWRHSQIQTAAAIRNHTAILQRRLARRTTVPSAMNGLFETVSEIDRLAEKIAAAPPRVPQSWEMEAELFPLAPLLEEVAQRETKSFSLRAGPPMEIIAKVEALGGVQVRGYRRWLIYALEALLQNARNAMFQGGTVTITGQRAGARAEIRIQDTGSGVPEAIRCKLFKELVKEQDRAGMGIGALLAATIIEEHEGSIELEKPGPGDTTVLISLPVAEEAEL